MQDRVNPPSGFPCPSEVASFTVPSLTTTNPTWLSVGNSLKTVLPDPPARFPTGHGSAHATTTRFLAGSSYHTGSQWLSSHHQPLSVTPKYHLGAQGHHVPPGPCSRGGGAVPLTNIHAQGDTQVHVLSPGVLGGVFAEHREDATVEVGLARRLLIAGDGNDGGSRAVPRHQVCRPAGKTSTVGLYTSQHTWERPGGAQPQGLSATRAPQNPWWGRDHALQEPLTNQLDALLDSQLSNWADHPWLSPLVVTISSPPSLPSAIRVFWSPNKSLLVSVAMLGWRGAIYSGLCKQALASQQRSLKVPCFEELLVFRVERAGASSAAQSMPRRKPSASQPPAEASKQASSSTQSSDPAPHGKQMEQRPKFILGSWEVFILGSL